MTHQRKDWTWTQPYGVYCQLEGGRTGPGTYWMKGFTTKELAGGYATAADKIFNMQVTICEQEISEDGKESQDEKGNSLDGEPVGRDEPLGVPRGAGLEERSVRVPVRADDNGEIDTPVDSVQIAGSEGDSVSAQGA